MSSFNSFSLKPAIIVCLVACLFFYGFSDWVGKGPDYAAHYAMATTRVSGFEGQVFSPNYAPLLPTIGGLVAVEEKYYKAIPIIIIFLITPLLIVGLTQRWYAALFYFSVSNYSYVAIAGFYSQALLLAFLLAIWYTRDNRIRLALFTIGSFSHSTGFILLGLGWISILAIEIVDWKWLSKRFSKIFLFCSPFWGGHVPVELNTIINNVGHPSSSLTINDVGGIFLKKTPIPFLWKATQSFFEKKQFHYISFAALSVVAGFFINDRIFDLLGILTIIGFTQQFEHIKNKKPWIILLIIYGATNVLQFVIVSSRPC